MTRVTWTRVAFMAALIAIALFLSRGIGATDPDVSKGEAVKIARGRVDFTPEGYNVRFIRQGVPPRPFWVVSYWIRRPQGGYSRITLVLVDARSGRVAEVRRVA